MTKHEAIYKLYPQVARILDDVAFDAVGAVVEYDQAAIQAEVEAGAYIARRRSEYPPISDYIDGVVKNDQAQIDAYIAACQAVKAKYPKPGA